MEESCSHSTIVRLWIGEAWDKIQFSEEEAVGTVGVGGKTKR
jgi:hypothetical protein